MLYFVTGSNNEYTWHVGETLPPSSLVYILKEVQADCDELGYIQQLLPFLNENERVVHFYNEEAKLVFYALQVAQARGVKSVKEQ